MSMSAQLSSSFYRRSLSAPRTWNSEDVRQLRQLAEQGVAPAVIAARLRRTESAIRNKAGQHGISLRGVAK